MEQLYFNTLSVKNQPLSRLERMEIKYSLNAGFSIRKIAKALGRAPSTISREIKRGLRMHRERTKYLSKDPNYPEFIDKWIYYPDAAELVIQERLSNRGGKYKLNKIEIIKFIEDKILNDKFSPDVVVNLVKEQFNFKICTKTLYNYIDRQILKVKNIDLLLKVKLKKRRKKRQPKIQLGTSIEQRPSVVNERLEFGHYEGDCIVGKGHKTALFTFNERITNKYKIKRLPLKNADSVMEALLEIVKENPSIKSITFDNGKEFTRCPELENLGIKIYYAHPYSAYERGANENLNGMTRRFLPKGTDFNTVTDEQLEYIENWINNYPRKKFKYYSANQMYEYEMQKLACA